MGKSLEPLEVQTTKDGKIALIQGSGLDPDCSAVVRITPDQVEELIFRPTRSEREADREASDRQIGEETEIENRETRTVRTLEPIRFCQ